MLTHLKCAYQPTTRTTAEALCRSYQTVVSGAYAYIADEDYGLQIVNIYNPSLPTYVGSYDTPNFATSVSVSGDSAYIGDSYMGIVIVNISDPAHPALAITYNR
ncbi:MAG TPA: hypothetical protein DCZ43_06940 [candidate division Zixibacteria bacterium]|jgi:hypothetical protein|nr:hypothetical protein [candidate division Zixibacteria bacterium]